MRNGLTAILYDLRFGIWRKALLFVPALLWGVWIAWRVDTACLAGQEIGEIAADTTFTLSDVLVCAFGGMTVYIPVAGKPFEIPVEWLLWFVYIALIASQYTYKHLCGIGQQQLIRFRRRRTWWIGKCVWSTATVLTAYAVFLLTVLVYTLLRGDMSATVSPWMWRIVDFPLRPDYTALGFGKLAGLCGMTALVSVVLTQWQTTLTLFVKPFGAFLAVVVITAAGAYVMTPPLIGNFAMWARVAWLAPDGFPLLLGAGLCAVYYVAAVIVGGTRFARYDVINIQE